MQILARFPIVLQQATHCSKVTLKNIKFIKHSPILNLEKNFYFFIFKDFSWFYLVSQK